MRRAGNKTGLPMKKADFVKQKSILSVWLVSYLLLFIFPFLVGIVIYIYGSDIVENEILRANSVILQQNEQKIDAIVEKMKGLANQVSLSPSMQLAQKAGFPMDNTELYNAFELSKNMSAMKSNANEILDFYVYLKNADYIISDYSNLSASEFYETYVPNEEYSYMQWKDLILASNGPRFEKIVVNINGKKESAVAYIQPIPMYQKNNYDSVVVLMTPENDLLESVKSDELFSKGSFIIMDQNNNTVATYGESYDLGKIDFSQEGRIQSSWYDKDTYMTYVVSETTNWKYIGLNPKGTFLRKMEIFNIFTIVLLLLCLCFGGLIVSYFLKKNYEPVRELMKMFGGGEGQKRQKENEYAYIKHGINKVISDKTQIFEEYKETMFVRGISDLLEGDTEAFRQNKELSDAFRQHFLGDHFAVMVINIENIDHLFVNEDISGSKKFDDAKFIITNILQELLEENNRSLVVNMKNLIVCLISRESGDNGLYMTEVEQVVEEMRKVIQKYFNFTFSVAAGDLCKGVEGVPVSYQEALSLMEYKVIFHKKEYLFYQQIQDTEKKGYYKYSLEDEMQLINNIKAGNAEVATKIIERIFRDNFETRTLSIQMARCFMFDMVSTMIKTIDDFKNDKDDFLWQDNKVERLISCKSIEEIKENVIELLTEVCEFSRERRGGSVVDSIEDYIGKHFREQDLSVNAVAEALEMNPAYLSSAFKEKTGQRLLDYINKKKMGYAASLLLDSNKTVEQVSEESGYLSSRTFIRVFKKYFGVTPKEYRKAKQQEMHLGG